MPGAASRLFIPSFIEEHQDDGHGFLVYNTPYNREMLQLAHGGDEHARSYLMEAAKKYMDKRASHKPTPAPWRVGLEEKLKYHGDEESWHDVVKPRDYDTCSSLCRNFLGQGKKHNACLHTCAGKYQGNPRAARGRTRRRRARRYKRTKKYKKKRRTKYNK